MAGHTPYYFEVYRDRERKFRWRFWAPNNRIMADSGQGYTTKQSCTDAINEIVQKAIGGLSIVYHASAA